MRVVIIIGLPGSGKTMLAQQYPDYELFDDFISTFNNFQLLKKLKESQSKLCLTDPRLCDFTIFQRYLQRIKRFIDQTEIQLILFENNPRQCLTNLELRTDHRKGLTQTINHYSQIYDLSKYHNYNHIIIPVWSLAY